MTNKATLEQYSYHYLFDLKNRESNELYFKMKNKYDYSFNKEEKHDFQQVVLESLNQNLEWKEATHLIVPETGNECLKELALLSQKEVIILEKNSKDNIKKKLDLQTMMKSEREKLYKTLDEMPIVKMANIAGNQRNRFISCLFKDIIYNLDPTDKVVFFDDSIFSGYTFLAAQFCIKKIEHKNIILFNKQA